MTIQHLSATLLGGCLWLAASSSELRAQYDRHGIHEVRVSVLAPECDKRPDTACFADSTRHYSDACCMKVSSAEWLIAGYAGDSVELFAVNSIRPALLTLAFAGRPFQTWQEHVSGHTASFVRLRLPRSGWYKLSVALDLSDTVLVHESDAVPYELRIRVVGNDSVMHRAPLLDVLGASARPIPVRLRWVSKKARGADVLDVSSAAYRVFAPMADELEICRVPCRTPRIVSLRAGDVIRVRP
jgi:hypothetical protein